MQIGGYTGKILYIDLTNRNIREERLDFCLAIKFIGDFGISSRLAYDLIKPGVDPLSPENVIIIGAGPLAGTLTIGSGRCHVVSKWPLTNYIGPAGGPMGFGSKLKYAGYDQLIIEGKSEDPVYIKISDNGVEILDARDLWGKDIYEVTDELWERHGVEYSVMCTGQAGEHLVKSAMCLIDKSGSIGRFGLGAIFGSKNLKSIITGGKKGVHVSDSVAFMNLNDMMMADVMNWSDRDKFVDIGHMQYDFDGISRMLGITSYYKEHVDVPTMEKRIGLEAYRKVKEARLACPSCSVPCREISSVKEGKYKGLMVYQGSFMISTGLHLRVKNVENMLKCTEVAQRYGLDRYAVMMNCEFLIDLFKRGIIVKKDLEGLDEMEPEERFIKLAKKMAFREGIGDVVADGLPGIVKRFGKECEKFGVYIKGSDVGFDFRKTKLGTMQLDMVVAPGGPNNGKGGMLNPGKFDPSASIESFKKHAKFIGVDSESLKRILDSPFKVNMGRLLRHTQDFYTIYCCLGQCMRVHMAQFYGIERLAKLYTAVTGIRMSMYDLKKAGERVWNVVKMLNVREGQSREDDKFPAIFFNPLKVDNKYVPLMDYFETKELTIEDVEGILDDYYDERGWEIKRGIPKKEKLEELGLNFAVGDI